MRRYVVAALKCANIVLVIPSRAADRFDNIYDLINNNDFIFVRQL